MSTVICTIRLSKLLYKCTFSKRANTAVKAIRKFAVSQFKADEVKIDSSINNFIWSQGRRNPPRKIRVEIEKTLEDNKIVCFVRHVPVNSFKGLLSEVQEE